MRYLNKIIFIESASIRYSEVIVDGNVHFTGTQGVGKSTLLRALLFFYNANQLKLGIPAGKKSFVDFYFPYQNSYIIYEVVRETGPFCVMVFKSQGRICYRFLDTKYEPSHFIDPEGRIFESWDKIKLAFGKGTGYTRKIDSYEEYRNILYGNNHGLDASFRKYSILESRQFQNIPRAIQHVFLNYKVESEFIKDTIIKSLNEEEIKIDLTNYAHHLKDFDTQLSDIKKWTEKTRTGEILIRKQAEKVIKTYLVLKHIAREKKQLAGELAWKLDEISGLQPAVQKRLETGENKYREVEQKVVSLEKKFQSARDSINKQINSADDKLKEIKKKSEEYAAINIEVIIQRVSKKNELEIEKENLLIQKNLLESRFMDIKQKYEAQINHLKNELAVFENLRQTEIHAAKEEFFKFRENLAKDYEKLFEELREQHQDEMQLAKNHLEEKQAFIHKLQLRKTEIKHRRFYEDEITNYNTAISDCSEKIRVAGNETKQQQDDIDLLRKQWDLERLRMEELYQRDNSKFAEEIAGLNEKIKLIGEKIENSKDSLYGWLNKDFPGWEQTIGKVIDEELLFKSGLSPAKVLGGNLNFYGISIDLNEITRTVKTMADYEKEKAAAIRQIESVQKKSSARTNQLSSDLENLKRKFQPKINKCRDAIRNNEYLIEQSSLKLNEMKVSLVEISGKAISEKKSALEEIDRKMEQTFLEKNEAENNLKEVEKTIRKKIDTKKKEKEKITESRQQLLNDFIDSIQKEVRQRKKENENKISGLRDSQKKEFDTHGAETSEIIRLENRISGIQGELEFISQRNQQVERYKYDKEELFDKAGHFKNQKILLDKQLKTEQGKHDQQKHKLTAETDLIRKENDETRQQLKTIREDLEEFEKFKLNACYNDISEYLNEPKEEYQTGKRCRDLISELNEKYYRGIENAKLLQESVNKFTGNFSAQNIFKFKTTLVEQEEYFQFAEDLKEFVEEDKISLFEKRVNELFADIIRQVGKETNDLLSKEGDVQKVISDINKDFIKRNFAGVIKSIELRVVPSENRIVHLLTEIKQFNDESIHDLGEANLFSTSDQNRDARNKKAIGFLSQLVKEISDYKHSELNLSDSFELEFKIVENNNDTNWVQNLANVGSDGTDVLVKAMINIMLLNVFKEGATRNRFKDFRLHCMMDEIGKLHPENVRGILKFANDRNINLINSSPQSFDALAYRHTYRLAKDENSITIISRLITNNRDR